eukprot:TRINITY_DN19729_c0_g1_i1.p1 TRINITY_DN19729_c0_g1~~TRINITY_DN19729_c0_g1_i1.p1  ORF type:complete len:132 (-),score=16.36 TRINITY_DN19729_c0_g1_i1:61-411(-)
MCIRDSMGDALAFSLDEGLILHAGLELGVRESGIDERPPAPLPKEIYRRLKMMKIGRTRKECSVCMCPFREGEVIRQLPCKHIFHRCCIKPWFTKQSTCPNCRDDVADRFAREEDL